MTEQTGYIDILGMQLCIGDIIGIREQGRDIRQEAELGSHVHAYAIMEFAAYQTASSLLLHFIALCDKREAPCL